MRASYGALEAALKFNETTGIFAAAFSIAEVASCVVNTVAATTLSVGCSCGCAAR